MENGKASQYQTTFAHFGPPIRRLIMVRLSYYIVILQDHMLMFPPITYLIHKPLVNSQVRHPLTCGTYIRFAFKLRVNHKKKYMSISCGYVLKDNLVSLIPSPQTMFFGLPFHNAKFYKNSCQLKLNKLQVGTTVNKLHQYQVMHFLVKV